MKLITRKAELGAVNRLASFLPASVRTEDRTVDVVFSTGARVVRMPFFSEAFVEDLSMDTQSVRLERFNGGAPLLKDHNTTSIDNQIGVVVEGSTRLENGNLVGTVKFSSDEDGERVFKNVTDGILRNVSIGYRIHKFEQLEERQDELKVFRAVDWEPFEVSFVTVPADPGAQVRSEDKSETFPCEIIERGTEVSKKLDDKAGTGTVDNKDVRAAHIETPAKPEIDVNAEREAAAVSERSRISEIMTAGRHAKMDDEVVQKHVSEGTTADEFRKLALQGLATADAADATDSTVRTEVGEDLSRVHAVRGLQDAFIHRAKPSYELDENAGQYRYVTMLEGARMCLKMDGIDVRGMSPSEVITRGLHSTSSFPILLADAMHKILRPEYAAAERTYQAFTTEGTLKDFRSNSRAQFGDAAPFKKLGEGGEFKRATISEGGESIILGTYETSYEVTRQMMVNDDLSFINRIPTKIAQRAAELDSDLVYGVINANAALQTTGNALFSTDHTNLSASGAAPSPAVVAEMRAAFRNQKGLDGLRLNVAPSYIVVGPNNEFAAEQLISQNMTADSSGNINPFAGRLQMIVDSRLDDNASTAWYLMARKEQVDMIELARLEGETGPQFSTEVMHGKGMKIEVYYDIGVKALDYRGMAKNPGA